MSPLISGATAGPSPSAVRRGTMRPSCWRPSTGKASLIEDPYQDFVSLILRLRLDDNTCDLELYSGECVEPGAGVRAHR